MPDLGYMRERLRRWGWVRVALGAPGLVLLLVYGGPAYQDMGLVAVFLLSMLAWPILFGARMLLIAHYASDEALSATPSLASVRLGLGPILTAFVLFVGVGILAVPACGCSTREKAYQAAMKSDLKNLASQQEIYFSDYGRYSTEPEALGFVNSDGVHVQIVLGGDGWAATTIHDALGTREGCAIYVGTSAPDVLTGGGLRPERPGEPLCD